MYILNYNEDNELISISNGDKHIPIDENNRDYKKYLEDIENGLEVEDNKKTEQEIINTKKQEAIEKAKRDTDVLVASGFEHDGNIYQSEEKDLVRLTALMAVKDNLISEVRFTLKGKDKKNVHPNDIEALCMAAFNHTQGLILACQEKIDQINNCTTIEELSELDE